MKTYYRSMMVMLSCIAVSCIEPDITIETPNVMEEAMDCSRTDNITTASTNIEYEFKRKDYYNIDQTIRISKLAPDMSWLVNVHFDGGTEGFFGFRSDENGETQITFSMTNAVFCDENENEGSICEDDIDNGMMQLRLDHVVALNDEYRFRIWRLGDAPGIETIWGLYVKNSTEYPTDFEIITDETGQEEGVILVGTITSTNARVLTGNSTLVSFDGFSYTDMNCMPQSKAYFSAPTANHNDPIRSFAEKAVMGAIHTDTTLNSTFKRYTSNGVFDGIEVTTGWE